MKLFLRDCCIFFTGIVLLNLIIYKAITYKHLYKDYEIEIIDLASCDTFIFADSHGAALTKNSQAHVNTLHKGKIYNFSYGSDSYGDIYLKLNWLISNSRIPRRVFLSADKHMLSVKREMSNNLNRSIYYADFLAYKELGRGPYFDFLLRKYFFKYAPMLVTSNSKLILKSVYSMLKNGEGGVIEWSHLEDSLKVANSQDKLGDHFQSKVVSKKNLRILEKILSLCNQYNIEVVGVKFPLAEPYYSMIKEIDLKVDSTFLSNGVVLLDYEALFIEDDSRFINQDHLNFSGSEVVIDSLLVN